MNGLWQDLRYGTRALLKNRGVALVAVSTLALGIGINSTIFSAVNVFLFRPLPVREPERLVRVYRTSPGFEYGSFSYPDFVDLRDQNRAFSQVAASRPLTMSLSFEGENQKIWGVLASGNYFALMGVEAARGRAFTLQDDLLPGGHPVTVLSDNFWRTRFAADPRVVGRELLINGHAFTVIGVMPEGFSGEFRGLAPHLWVPMMMEPQAAPGRDRLQDRGAGWLQVLGRLKPGVTAERAAARVELLGQQWAEQNPSFHRGGGMRVVALGDSVFSPTNQEALELSSAVLLAVVGLVLLIACANIANLLMARFQGRRAELGLRLALGARRGRLIRQLLTESALLGLAGGAAGLLVAFWLTRLLPGLIPDTGFPLHLDLAPDHRVLLFTFSVSLATGLIFGFVPALQSARVELFPVLKGDLFPARRRRRVTLTRMLVVSQVAFSLLLLIVSALFIQSFRNAQHMNPGFRTEGLLLASLDPALHGYGEEEGSEFYRRLLQRLASQPGVESVSAAEMVPLALSGNQQWGVRVEGYQPAPDERMNLDYNIIAPDYFKTMGISLLQGREFSFRDDSASAPVILVNQTMAERFWPGQMPLGKRVRLGGVWRRVVGVVEDHYYYKLGESPLAYMYLPVFQLYNSQLNIHLRSKDDPTALVGALRREVAELNPHFPLFDIRTLEEHASVALFPARVGAGLIGAFSALALLLAAIGLYGVLAYSVASRTREIGIRMALGSSRPAVMRRVLGQGFSLVLTGAVLGLAASLALSRILSRLLYGIEGMDALSFLGSVAVLATAALAASFLPARRAMGVDPLVALKYE